MTLFPYNLEVNKGNERDRDMQNPSNDRNEDKIEGNHESIIRGFQMQYKVKYIRAGRRIKYIVTGYGYGPDADTVERLQRIQPHFISRY